MRSRPEQVSRSNAASYPLRPGRFYTGTVTSVTANGQVTVKVNSLQNSFGPVFPIGTTPYSKLSVGDSVVCTFTDEFFKDVIVFGSSRLKPDVFALKSVVTALQATVSNLAARVAALEAE